MGARFWIGVVVGLCVAASAGDAAGADRQRGERLYRVSCARCHGLDGGGGGRDAALFAEPPPSLRGTLVLARYTDSELVAWVRGGKQLDLGLRPDLLRQHSGRTTALYRHLGKMPGVRWELADAGREIYYARCLECHDEYGHPAAPGIARPRDLSDPALHALDDVELEKRVRHRYANATKLARPVSEDEARHLAAFVRLFSPGYELYDRFCQGCHGSRGEGVADAPVGSGRPSFAFDTEYFRRHEPQHVIDNVWHMLRDAKARMPHLAASLDESDVRSVVDHLRSLGAGGESRP